ncbi:thiolase family protein [Pseudomonas aeruginosa]|uniref:thiolase family protein n=1 Tax=Pseudomonas aeruginosa TaxID=287 RepID=UPI0010686CD6|nr:thiolase family protein [Pseudomonas aeruginosa]TEO04731.1 thiolase family protein [Pseudomonas aeruginosa]TEO05551.1 thiolase family protein [Pseudomonas aeruginosa]TEO10244.1 thiolase family protein [Pseudomonas aeruginosa]
MNSTNYESLDLKGKAAVVGVGATRYGKLPEYDSYDLGLWALSEALDDCGLEYSDIDGLISNRIPSYGHFAELCGINPRYTLATPGHGRFSGICIQTAALLVASGIVNTVALVYANDGASAGTQYGGDPSKYGGAAGAYGAADGHWAPYGMTSPGAFHALMMQRHMHLYGTTEQHLGHVAVTFRQHAQLNPNAVMRTPFTMDEYLATKHICEPLRLLDYCLINDGAVAMIITRADLAEGLRKPPVYIRGASQASQFADSSFPPEDFWAAPMRTVATDVYAMAGVCQKDIDGLMIYDNFTPTVLFTLEGFGFCKPGQSGPWVAEGHLGLDGQYPSNTNGGHLSESYLQGWGLNVEAVRQLRGECGDRQMRAPKLVQYMAASPVVTSVIYGREKK